MGVSLRQDLTKVDIGRSLLRNLAEAVSGRSVVSRPSGASNDEMTIAFGVDTSYLPHLGVTITSILDNAPGGRFRFFILHDGILQQDRDRLEACAPGQRFEWHEIHDERLLGLSGHMHISRATFYRLSLPSLLPGDLKRVLYLDCDLVVTGDVRGLLDVDLGENAIGAVYDVGVDSEVFAAGFGLPPLRLAYFNAGVILIDLEKARQGTGFQSALDLVLTRRADLEYGDQCALNIAFWGAWTRLDTIWNVQRRMIVLDEGKPVYAEMHELPLRRRPIITHFTEINKPWSKDPYHPYVWKYYHYLARTPYWDEVNAQAGMTFGKRLRRRVKTMLYWGLLEA